MTSSKPLVLAFCIGIICLCVHAQELNTENDLCNIEYAKFLASQQVTESRSVREPEKRIKILIRSAEFAWKIDEPAAREYFTEAYKLAVEDYNERGMRSAEQKDGIMTVPPDMRLEVVRSIAKFDSKWMQKLTEEILKEFEKAAKDRKGFDKTRELNTLLWIAAEIADTDPDTSWYLLRSVMKYELDQHWFHSLYSVGKKNLSMSSALYQELLMRYQNEPPQRLLYLAGYPFASDRSIGIDKYQVSNTPPPDLTPDVELQRRFIEVFFNRVNAYANDPQLRMQPPGESYRLPEVAYMASALDDLEPHIMTTLPFLLSRFSAARAQVASMMTEEIKKNMDTRAGYTSQMPLSFEERIALLEEADKEGKLEDSMIIGLVTFWGKRTDDNFNQLEPWLDKIKEESPRVSSTSYFWYKRADLAIKENRFADANKYAQRVPELEHRAILAFDLARAQLESINDAASAYQTLAEVAKLARTMDESPVKAKILLGLAHQYEKMNVSFAMEELAEAVRVLNRQKDPDMSSSSIMRIIKGEKYTFYAVLTAPGFNIEDTFRKMGEADFGMTLSNAKALDDRYLRTIAVINSARLCSERPLIAEADDSDEGL